MNDRPRCISIPLQEGPVNVHIIQQLGSSTFPTFGSKVESRGFAITIKDFASFHDIKTIETILRDDGR
jgi:hypothetical protein